MAGRGALGPAPLVGRGDELAAAMAVLRPDRPSVRRGRASRAVVVVGDAGVGKSRLADEVVASCEALGGEGSVVRVTAALGSVPLGAVAALVPLAGWPAGRRADLLVAAADMLAAGADRLMVIDDAHLLDPMSAGALHLAAVRSPVRLLLTVRAGAPCDEAVTALWKDGLAERIDLAPLDRASTDALAVALLGAPLDGVSSGQLWESSGGNALFVRELLLGALDDGLVVRTGDVHRFAARPRTSARLAELLGARLDDLSAAEREALDLLAIGGEIGLATLRSVIDDEVLTALEDHGLLTVATDGRRRPARLVHPLYGELLRERMGRVREMAMNRALSEQLEGHGARRRNDALDLARWQVASGAIPRPDVLLTAARQARSRFDPVLAEHFATLAGDAGAGVDADLLVADSLEDRGLHARAAERLEAAFEDAVSDDDIVRAVSALSVIEFWALGDEDRAAQTVRTAAERVVGDDARNELDAHLASFEAMANRPGEALERVARHLGNVDGRAYLVAAIAAGPALTAVGRTTDAIALMDRALPARLAVGDADALPAAFQYTMSKVFALSESGELTAAAALADETYRFAASLRAVAPVAWSAMVGGRVALLTGDLRTASARFGEASQLFVEIEEAGLRSWAVAGAVLAAAQRGDAADAAARVLQLRSIDPGPVRALQADVDRAEAWERRVAGDARTATSLLEAAITDADARGAFGMSLSLVHDVARCGDRTAVRLVRDEHRRVQGELAAVRLAFLECIAVDDADALDGVVGDFVERGALLFAAEAAAAAAAAHQRAGSVRRASSSRARSTELRAACPDAVTPLLAPTPVATGLTGREREVAELAAAGRSSREIADALGRSVRTVENHLQRAYDKLGITGRADLAVALGTSASRA
jgi:DNA-binding CsgD family transcriptional regulator